MFLIKYTGNSDSCMLYGISPAGRNDAIEGENNKKCSDDLHNPISITTVSVRSKRNQMRLSEVKLREQLYGISPAG